MMRAAAARQVALVIAAALLWPLAAEASTSKDLSLKPASFAAAPQLVTPSLAEELRAIEAKASKAADCVALCDIAASVEAHPFGVALAEPSNRSEDAWGNYRFTSELAPSKNRFGFTGHYWDNEAGLYYAKARFYDPQLALFTQADSFLGNIDNPPSLHRYAYAADNPTLFVDLTGNDFSLNTEKKYGIDGVAAPVLSGKITDNDLRQYGAYAHRFGTRDDELQAIAFTSNAYTQSWGKEVINLELSSIGAILPAEFLLAKAGAMLAKGRGLAAFGLRLLGGGVAGGVQQGTKSALDGNGAREIAEDTGIGFGVGTMLGVGFEAFGAFRDLLASRAVAAERALARAPTRGVRGRDFENLGGEFADDAIRMKEESFDSIGGEPRVASGEVRFKRWSRGEAIDKPLPDGSSPSWDVVRERYWKNRYEASRGSGEFSAANLEKMRRGKAPVDYNPRTGVFEERELHHVIGQQYGGPNAPLNIRELTPDWHAEVDPFRIRDGVSTTRGIR